jgi:hypothetical protein
MKNAKSIQFILLLFYCFNHIEHIKTSSIKMVTTLNIIDNEINVLEPEKSELIETKKHSNSIKRIIASYNDRGENEKTKNKIWQLNLLNSTNLFTRDEALLISNTEKEEEMLFISQKKGNISETDKNGVIVTLVFFIITFIYFILL